VVEPERRPIDWDSLADRLLAAALVGVVVLNVVNAYVIATEDWKDSAGALWLLLNTEGNPATWFSSVTLLLAGVCALATGRIGRIEHERFWLLVGGVLVLMSVEEVAQLHDLISGNLSSSLDEDAGVAAIWVIPGGILVVGLLVVLVRIAPPLERRLVVRLLGGTALFVIGALGFEMLSGEIFPEQENDPRRNLVLATFEENFEMAGALVLAWATSQHLMAMAHPRPIDA
jgi:hypothetical protein